MTTASHHGERCLRDIARDFSLPEKGRDDGVLKQDVIYDDEADRVMRGPLKCLIIGEMKVGDRSREEMRSYVLILARKKEAPENVYERIGPGFIDGSLIAFDENPGVSWWSEMVIYDERCVVVDSLMAEQSQLP
jgi:hypothetical protein